MEHVILECRFVDAKRFGLKESLLTCGKEFSIASALGEMKVTEHCEKLLASFFGIFKS